MRRVLTCVFFLMLIFLYLHLLTAVFTWLSLLRIGFAPVAYFLNIIEMRFVLNQL